MVGGLDELLGDSCEGIVLVEIFVGAVDGGLRGHCKTSGRSHMDAYFIGLIYRKSYIPSPLGQARPGLSRVPS